jgi:hypothetical protein
MDPLVPGFGVRVTDKGVKTYILQTGFRAAPTRPGARSTSTA